MPSMSKDYGFLWKNVINVEDEGDAVQILLEILSDKEGRHFITNLEDKEDAKRCIEILDNAIAERKLRSAEKQVFLLALRRLAGAQGRLPGSMMITDPIDVEEKVLASGGFADVRCGTYLGRHVAVKTLRVTEYDDVAKIRKYFCKEVILWSTLKHPNVLKFVGVEGMEAGKFVYVSEWMEHGNIIEYIKKYPVNRLELLHDSAQGLKYIHGAGLSHGDLKGPNILISNHTPPRACLADFGYMTMVLDPINPMSCSVQLEGGTKAFMSPELLVPQKYGLKDSIPTPQADIYAFGMVIFQVLTGGLPFRGMRDAEMACCLIDGLRPKKPENASAIGFSVSLWDFVQRCWSGNMELRPQVAELVTHLKQTAREWNRPMPPHVQVEGATSTSQDIMSGSAEQDIFNWGAISKCHTESKGTSVPFSCSSTPFAQYADLSPEEPRRVMPAKQRERLHYPHLEETSRPPPSPLPQLKRGPISKHLLQMFTPQKKRNIAVSSSSSAGYRTSRLVQLHILPPSSLPDIISESTSQSSQGLIDRIDRVSSL